MVKIDKDKFIAECRTSASMAEAAAKLKLHFNTFRRYAIKLGCYKPNQGLRGGKRNKKRSDSYALKDVLNGKYPNYQTFKLKNRLMAEGIKENRCEVCGIVEWNEEQLNMELHHLDGDRTNHKLSNLQIICPNCHSQPDTFRARNKVEH